VVAPGENAAFNVFCKGSLLAIQAILDCIIFGIRDFVGVLACAFGRSTWQVAILCEGTLVTKAGPWISTVVWIFCGGVILDSIIFGTRAVVGVVVAILCEGTLVTTVVWNVRDVWVILSGIIVGSRFWVLGCAVGRNTRRVTIFCEGTLVIWAILSCILFGGRASSRVFDRAARHIARHVNIFATKVVGRMRSALDTVRAKVVKGNGRVTSHNVPVLSHQWPRIAPCLRNNVMQSISFPVMPSHRARSRWHLRVALGHVFGKFCHRAMFDEDANDGENYEKEEANHYCSQAGAAHVIWVWNKT
jgi:hypothetical protein